MKSHSISSFLENILTIFAYINFQYVVSPGSSPHLNTIACANYEIVFFFLF